MTDPIDLHDPIAEICKRLELDAHDVLRIELRPTTADVLILKRKDGKAYVIDEALAVVATGSLSYRITS